MTKKVKRRLADDIRASLHETLDHAAGKRTKVVVRKPSAVRSRRIVRQPESRSAT